MSQAAQMTKILNSTRTLINAAPILLVSFREAPNDPQISVEPMMGRIGKFGQGSNANDVMDLYLFSDVHHVLVQVVRHYASGSGSRAQSNIWAQGVPLSVTSLQVVGFALETRPSGNMVEHGSATFIGAAAEVTDAREKAWAMQLVVDGVVAGQWARSRPLTPTELDNAVVLRVQMQSGSLSVSQRKSRELARNEPDHVHRSVWSGFVPARTVLDPPRTASLCQIAQVPPELEEWRLSSNKQAEMACDLETSGA